MDSEDLSEPVPEEDSWVPLRHPSIIVPTERFQDPYPYSERVIHQSDAVVVIPQQDIQISRLRLIDHGFEFQEVTDVWRQKTDRESKAKDFTGFTDKEKEELEKSVGIKTKVLQNFYNCSDFRKRCIGGTGNFLIKGRGKSEKAALEPSCRSQINKFGMGNMNKMEEVDVGGEKNINDVIKNGVETGEMNGCVATVEDKKIEKEESEDANLTISVPTSVITSKVNACNSTFQEDHCPIETSLECTDNSLKTKMGSNVDRERKESSESSSSSSLEIKSMNFGSDNDDDYDWSSVDNDDGSKEELYETGMLPPAYPKKTLESHWSSENSYLFCGCEEKEAVIDGGDDYVDRANKGVPKSEPYENKKRSLETGSIFMVSNMLMSGSLDSAMMRFQIDQGAAKFDHDVDELLKSYSSDQSFQWNPPKNNLRRKGLSSNVLTPKPNMQCSKCKKYEHAAGLLGSAMRSFICYNCVEFDQHAVLDRRAASKLLTKKQKPKVKVSASSKRTVLKKRKRKRR